MYAVHLGLSLVAFTTLLDFSSGDVPKIRRSLDSSAAFDGNDPAIPHTIWFSESYTTLLETRTPVDAYNNVANTIDKYRQLWGDPIGLQSMDKDFCISTISTVSPHLLPHFHAEEAEANRREICKIAALFLYGDYFFDTDIEVVDHVHPSSDTRFMALVDCGGGCFSPQFLAAAQWHPVLEHTLKNMLNTYENNEDTTLLGPVSMANAYHSVSELELEDTELLEVLQLNVGHANDGERYPHIQRVDGKKECNEVLHDRKKNKIHFFKRFRREGGCVRRALRLNWTNLPPISPLAKQIDSLQSKCMKSSSPEKLKFKLRKEAGFFGLGADLMYASASLCDALDNDLIVINRNEWIWMDSEKCTFDTAHTSPYRCYFGKHESASSCNITLQDELEFDDVDTSAFEGDKFRECSWHRSENTTKEFRAASFEWLFQSMTPIVIEEAERQVREAFGPEGLPDPEDLVTVHIRWGDKYKEMELRTIDEYIDAVKQLTQQRRSTKPLHIYLASEDPRAIREFHAKVPSDWKIHSSGPTNDENENDMVKNASGRAGLESLGALLVSLEANNYVLTLASNWSHLIDYLRRGILNPRCGNCTRMIDLLYGWV